MSTLFSLASMASLIAGILLLAVPRLLNVIVAAEFILIGLIGLVGASFLRG